MPSCCRGNSLSLCVLEIKFNSLLQVLLHCAYDALAFCTSTNCRRLLKSFALTIKRNLYCIMGIVTATLGWAVVEGRGAWRHDDGVGGVWHATNAKQIKRKVCSANWCQQSAHGPTHTQRNTHKHTQH